MTTINRTPSVSAFQPLGTETVKQADHYVNNRRNTGETSGLKALASHVLERNKQRSKDETKPHMRVSAVTPNETVWARTEYADLYQERAAILEFDADLSRTEAEYLARREVLHEFVNTQYPVLMATFNASLQSRERFH